MPGNRREMVRELTRVETEVLGAGMRPAALLARIATFTGEQAFSANHETA